MVNEKSVMAVIRAARPSFRNNHDKVAFALHASFLASGYILTATGSPASADNALSATSTDEVGIDHWNELDEYAFVYINPEKGSKKVLVKALALNEKLIVTALADGGSELLHLEINVGDYVDGEQGGNNYSTQFKNLDKLVKSVDKEILSKLDGSSSKAKSSSNAQSLERNQGLRISGEGVPDSSGPQRPPPEFLYPPIHPVGGSDLYPGPGAGMYPPRGDFGGGSMLLGPNDPRWFGGYPGGPGFPGGQPGIPPGARFDPYGPPGVPGFEPNRFIRHQQRPRGPDGIHPDLEHYGSGNGQRPGARGGIHPDLEHFGGRSDFI
ncbi:hypothetical protein UlMin_000407 [Ulmus minor]